MNNISESKILFVVLIGAVLLIVLGSSPSISKKRFGDSTFNRFIATSTTNTSVSCPSQVATSVLSGSGSRNYGLFTNDSANNIYLCFASTCASSTGARLNANGGSLELKYDNLYVGPISCVAATATSTLDVIFNQ